MAGTLVASVSGAPASNRRTFHSGTSESLFARADPDAPEPIIMKSYSFGSAYEMRIKKQNSTSTSVVENYRILTSNYFCLIFCARMGIWLLVNVTMGQTFEIVQSSFEGVHIGIS